MSLDFLPSAPHNLGIRAKALRLSKKLEIADLAELSGLSKDCISYIERTKRKPNGITLSKLARGLKTSVEYLLHGEDYKRQYSLGKRIAKKRSETGLSQIDFAKKIEVGAATIMRWETDRSIPRLKKFIALNNMLEIIPKDSDPFMFIAGVNLKNYRKHKRLTRREVGLILNVHESTVKQWETYKQFPSKDELEKIKNLLTKEGFENEFSDEIED